MVVTVQDREKVRVPFGEVEAWKVLYRKPGSGRDYFTRAWFAPGIGFVRFENWDVLESGERRNDQTYELTRYEPERHVTPLAPARFTAEDRANAERLVASLQDPQVDVREKAMSGLVAIGRGVVPFIREQAANAKDPELRGRLEQVLKRVPRVELLVRKLKDRGKVGEPLPLRVALRNISDSKVAILPSLGRGPGASWVRYDLEIRDEKGVTQEPRPTKKGYICAFVNPLKVEDFVTLASGEECEAFGPGTDGHRMHPWIPSSPGTYTVSAVVDTEAWKKSPAEVDQQIFRLLEAMPRGRFESNSLVLVVDP
jgi:hypothetical protein